MKIAFCVSPLLNNHSTRGIGSYTKNLLENLKKIPKLHIQEFSDISEIENADVIHYPFFDLFQKTLTIKKKIPTVVTIHDVIPLEFSDHYPAGIKGSINKFLQKKSLKRVAAVITDSQYSKKSITKHLGISENKIFSIPLAPIGYFHKIDDEKRLEKIKDKYKLPSKFALFTGNVNWNKNLLNLSEASVKADIDLVLIGKSFEERNNLYHPELKSFKQFLKKFSSNPKIHILGYIPDEDLVEITNLADLQMLPSFAEGFGLPILDAQICGTPVITSNISSMPEVAGRGALMVDPASVEDISRAIKRITDNKEIREELIKEGFKNVKRFSWEKTAQDTAKVYDEIFHS